MKKNDILVMEGISTGKIEKEFGKRLLEASFSREYEESPLEKFAIIGIAVNFPQASTLDDFWHIIAEKKDCIGAIPEKRRVDALQFMEQCDHFNNAREQGYAFLNGAYLDSISEFDASFFGISAGEATLMDPMQRLFLENAYHALEDAGYGGKALDGANAGVYVAFSSNIKDSYLHTVIDTKPESLGASLMGNMSPLIPSRLSYFLNLKGPSMVIDTACSSSLVAVHTACQGMMQGDCDFAIVSGIKVFYLPLQTESLRIGVESPEGRARTFDKNADGSGIGDGIATIILKPLKDAQRDHDDIYAVICGSAINHDGTTMSIAAPSSVSQEEVILAAWQKAGVTSESIAYVETHGTGTRLGDPIELDGLSRAFSRHTKKRQFCAVGSIKPNLGHQFECAGISGLIKAVLALRHQMLPPTLNFDQPAQLVDLTNSALYINERLRFWSTMPGELRRCGVSAFGLSGTNCHMVLEEYPQTEKSQCGDTEDILLLSAHTEGSLIRLCQAYCEMLERGGHYTLSSICHAARIGRGHYAYRLAICCTSISDLLDKLKVLLTSGFDTDTDWYRYGYNESILTLGKRNYHNNRKSSDALLRELGRIAEQLFMNKRTSSAAEWMGLYVKGAQIDWCSLLAREKNAKARLPLYPYEAKRHWVESAASSLSRIMRDQMAFEFRWMLDEDIKLPLQTRQTVLIVNGEKYWARHLGERLHERGHEVYLTCVGDQNTIDVTQIVSLQGGRSKTFSLESLSHIVFFCEPNRNKISKPCFDLLESFIKLVGILAERVKQAKLSIAAFNTYEVTGEEQSLCPDHAVLAGVGKVIPQEYDNLSVQYIDFDEATPADTLADEIMTSTRLCQCAYRQGRRYIEVFAPAQVDPSASLSLAENGVYVITGGADGIGAVIAQHLAQKAPVTLIVIGRTRLPAQRYWAEATDEKYSANVMEKIIALRAMHQAGAQVYYYSADVADVQKLRRVIAAVKRKFGGINGVIHSAGIAGAGYMARKDFSDFMAVVAPKVFGAWALHQATLSENLDFFVLFSSAVTAVGEAGQSDYVAANAYLDAFAQYRKLLGRPATVIDWVAWRDVGMSVRHGVNRDAFFKAILREEGVAAFDRIVASQINRVLVGKLSEREDVLALFRSLPIALSHELESYLPMRPLTISDEIVAHGETLAFIDQSGVKLLPKSRHQGVLHSRTMPLFVNEQRTYDAVKLQIEALFCDALGLPSIDPKDSFFELGGDSVLLVHVHRRIEQAFPGRMKIADLFRLSSVEMIAREIAEDPGQISALTHKNVKNALLPIQCQDKYPNAIAIIGMDAHLPGEYASEETLLVASKPDCVSQLPKGRAEDARRYLRRFGARLRVDANDIQFMKGAYLEKIDQFDAAFFGMTPMEAILMDPVHRLYMENVYHAIEDSGHAIKDFEQTSTGLYVGYASNVRDSYMQMVSDIMPDNVSQAMKGNFAALIPSQMAHLYNFSGPCIVVDTACSSSLVAVHMACNALLTGECEVAIASGIRVSLLPVESEYMNVGVESTDAITRSFDGYSGGAGSGEGLVSIVLKPLWRALEDGDYVRAVIRGSAINHDGASQSITAPNPQQQSNVLAAAWERAGVDPSLISYIEAHGTGTPLGDPIEIAAIEQALLSSHGGRKQSCAVASLKPVFGHLNECAGIAGLYRAVFALETRTLPASAHMHYPNTNVDWACTPVYINTRPRAWQNERLICGVSAFGLSGTNCHVVLENHPLAESHPAGRWNVLAISAHSEWSLRQNLNMYAYYFEQDRDDMLEDVCFTANVGRTHYEYRCALIACDSQEFLQRIRKLLQSTNASLAAQVFLPEEKEYLDDSEQFNKLMELANAYVSGEQVAWQGLYEHATRVHLPKYCFDRKRCWVDEPCEQDEGNVIAPYLRLEWVREDLPTHLTPANGQIYVVIHHGDDYAIQLCNEMTLNGADVHSVCLSKEKKGIEPDDGSVDYQSLLGPYLLCEELLHIVFVNAFLPEVCRTLDDLRKQVNHGMMSLIKLVQTLYHVQAQVKLHVLLYQAHRVEGSEETLYPEAAAQAGFCKVVAREIPHLSVTCIDTDGTHVGETVREIIGNNGNMLIALREDGRYVQHLCEFSLSAERGVSRIRSGGVYVFSGGTGGIAHSIATDFLNQTDVHLVMLSRGILEASPVVCANGSTIEHHQVDLTDVEGVMRILDNARAKFGAIHGVIHCAGVGTACEIIALDEIFINQIIAPKIYGTWALDQATAGDELDFFLACSSVATVFPAPMQSIYAAANAYLEAWAADKKGVAQIVQWTTWKQTGMAKRSGHVFDGIFKAMDTEFAIRHFNEFFSHKIPIAVIGAFNLPDALPLLQNTPVSLSPELREKLRLLSESSLSQRELTRKCMEQSAPLMIGETINQVEAACKNALGFDDIDIHRNFFELGMDSICIMAVHRALDQLYPGRLQLTDFFEHSTPALLAQKLEGINKKDTTSETEGSGQGDVAIIGISVNLPMAKTLDEFWENICLGMDCSTELTGQRKQDFEYQVYKQGLESKVAALPGHYLERVDTFDASFFHMSPRDAKLTDPNHRIFLQTAYHAMEDAGYAGVNCKGKLVGVYLGYSTNIRDSYARMLYSHDIALAAAGEVGNTGAVIPGRLSYFLDLHGPSIVVDTACSSSLVAVDVAVKALRDGTCDMALVAGIKLTLMPMGFVGQNDALGIASADGLCRAFDAQADGAGSGEGAICIVLKPLAEARHDGDHIYALIKGAQVNQDGKSAGITAPNPQAQRESVERACRNAGVKASSVGYYEAHGTGTQLGDPTEMAGLIGAVDTGTRGVFALGSVKSNIGHLSEGAGLSGLVKTVLAMRHCTLPPTALFNSPNMHIDFINSPFFVNERPREWPSDKNPMRCGVSSFGLSGTNCHVVLEAAPDEHPIKGESAVYALPVSAHCENALRDMARHYIDFLEQAGEDQIQAICHTAALRRRHYAQRLVAIGENIVQLRAALKQYEDNTLADKRIYDGYPAAEKPQELLTLRAMCEQYVQGEDVDWQAIYSGTVCVSLPAYTFQEKRYWFEDDTSGIPHKEVLRQESVSPFTVIRWIPSEKLGMEVAKKGAAVYFAEDNQHKLINELWHMDSSAILVNMGDEYGQTVARTYTMRDDLEDYQRVLSETEGVDCIVYSVMLVSNSDDEEETMLQRLRGLFFLGQALAARIGRQALRVVVLADYAGQVTGDEANINPYGEAAFGLAKVIGLENPSLEIRCIDIDAQTPLSTVVKAITCDDAPQRMAFREDRQYIEEYAVIDLPAAQQIENVITRDATYVVLGGTGGIGLTVASAFSSCGAGVIAMIGRKELPPREQWEALAHGDGEIAIILQSIFEIERFGARIAYYTADMANYEQLKNCIRQIRAEYGRIAGVVHSAGVAGDGFLANKPYDVFKQVAEDKILSVLYLDRLTREDMPDFFALMSSIGTIASEPGQGDYICANAFVEAFARHRSLLHGRTIAMSWAAWGEIGMAVAYGVNVDGLYCAIETSEGKQLFLDALCGDRTQIYIGKLNLKSKFIELLMNAPFQLSEEIAKMARPQVDSHIESARSRKEVVWKGERDPNKYERAVADAYGDALGVEQITQEDDFFALGGDSIGALRVVTVLMDTLCISVTVADVMGNSKLENLAKHLEKQGGGKVESVSSPVTGEDTQPDGIKKQPLAPVQRGLFLLEQYEQIGTSYNLPAVFTLNGEVDVKKIEEAFRAIIQRHEALRTSFVYEADEMVAVIYPDVAFSLEHIDVDGGEEELKAALQAWVTPFNIAHPPLLRAVLIYSTLGDFMIYDMHHIISDGTTNYLIQRDFMRLYQGDALPPLKITYGDYVTWYLERMKCEEMQANRAYWHKELGGELPQRAIASDYLRGNTRAFTGEHFNATLDEQYLEEFRRFTSERRLTMFSVLIGALSMLLCKLTGETQSVIGSPMHGRFLPQHNEIVGMFVNTLALRVEIHDSETVGEFLQRVQAKCIEAFAHQEYPYADLIEELDLKTDFGRNPLFDVMLVLQNYNICAEDTGITEEFVVCDISDQWNINNSSKFDLSINVKETRHRLEIDFEYRADLFKASTIQAIAGYYLHILQTIVHEWDGMLSDLSLIDNDNIKQVLNRAKGRTIEHDTLTVLELFERQAKCTPDATAIVHTTKTWTYEELQKHVNLLFRRIIAYHPQGDYVAVLAHNAPEAITAFLAVMKAGKAYVPVGPASPELRNLEILRDCNPGLILTMHSYNDMLREYECDRIFIDDADIFYEENAGADMPIHANDIAYMLYTSGSTGTPKGVMVSAANLRAYVASFLQEFCLTGEDAVLQQAALVFDASVEEIYPALAVGASVVIPPAKDRSDPDSLLAFAASNKVTVVSLSPLMLREFNMREACRSIRLYISGGDVLMADYYDRLLEHGKVYNSYGPTETTVCATYYECTPMMGQRVPIGYPIAGVQVYVLDDSQHILPPYIPGEIYIAGSGVALGYFGREELTKQVFIENPFGGGRLYRSGDIGRVNGEGALEFLGRKDRQIKRHGIRIECGEIETQMLSFPGIQEAAVHVTNTKGSVDALNAFYAGMATIDEDALWQYLRARIPAGMMCTTVTRLEVLPRTASGKIDYVRLPDPDLRKDEHGLAANSMLEADINRVWEEVLVRDSIGVNDSFFEIGGDSIKAIAVVTRLRKDFDISVDDLFEHQTIRSLAEHLVTKKTNRGAVFTRIEQALTKQPMTAEESVHDDHDDEIERQRNAYDDTIDMMPEDNPVPLNGATVLLTGATGYFGRYLLRELLRKGVHQVIAIIRAKDDAIALERLEKNMSNCFKEEQLMDDRVCAIAGDISQPLFGLEQHVYDELALRVDMVLHSAALISRYGQFSTFHRANVLGTQHVAMFTKHLRAKQLHYISTVGIAVGEVENTARVLYTEDSFDVGQRHTQYYDRTKMEAEQVVREMMQQGLSARIYRLGNLVNDYATGTFRDNIHESSFYLLMQTAIRLGCIPEIEGVIADFSYVDVSARAVIELMSHGRDYQTYHVIGRRTTMIELAAWINAAGTPINVLPASEFIALLRQYDEQDLHEESITNILSFSDFGTTKTEFLVEDRRTTRMLARLNVNWPEIDEIFIARMIANMPE